MVGAVEINGSDEGKCDGDSEWLNVVRQKSDVVCQLSNVDCHLSHVV